ncbi:ABC transporter transmembrane domain-containing protein [Shigella flexneri]
MGGLVTRTVGYHAGSISALPSAGRFSTVCNKQGQRGFRKPAGSWATLVLQQIDDMHDYYARYLPQMALAVSVPLLIVVAIFPSTGLRRSFCWAPHRLFRCLWRWLEWGLPMRTDVTSALARLSGHFLDRLRGMETLRIFGRGEAEIESIRSASEDFRQRTMEVLRLAFLSFGILEFFTSLSIALVAVYFGFS